MAPQSLRFRVDASQRFVGRQFQFAKLIFRQTTDAVEQKCFGNGPHLEGQRDRRLTQSIVACFDHCGSGESRSIEVGGQRDDEDGLQCSRESVTLPNHDRAPAGLLAGTVGS